MVRRRHHRERWEGGVTYHFLYVDQKGFEQHPPKTLAALAAGFTEYQS